jgi:hypothetical protein
LYPTTGPGGSPEQPLTIVSHRFPLTEVNEVLAQQDKGAITRSSLVP